MLKTKSNGLTIACTVRFIAETFGSLLWVLRATGYDDSRFTFVRRRARLSEWKSMRDMILNSASGFVDVLRTTWFDSFQQTFCTKPIIIRKSLINTYINYWVHLHHVHDRVRPHLARRQKRKGIPPPFSKYVWGTIEHRNRKPEHKSQVK